jgi:hypothetical protein
MKPELKARVEAEIGQIVKVPKSRARPKLVSDHGRVVADAVVIVSEWDFNWWRTDAWSRDGELVVRRDTLRDRATQLVLQMRRRA